MIILDGNKLAKEILEDLAGEIREKQLQLKTAVILLGNNLISSSYVNKKKEACETVGVGFQLFNFPSDIGGSELREKIKKIIDDKSISGIVIQLPLPQKVDTSEILNLIPVSKDIDVLSDASFEKFSKNNLPILPPVVGAVNYIFEKYKIPIKGKKIVLIGKGKLVGKPLSVWLTNNEAEFYFIDKSVGNVGDFTKNSDIIISGAGFPGLVKKDMIKAGAVLIDVGTSSENGKIKGDIDSSAYQKASYVAPVPGGVGPLTIACLISNLVKINQKYE